MACLSSAAWCCRCSWKAATSPRSRAWPRARSCILFSRRSPTLEPPSAATARPGCCWRRSLCWRSIAGHPETTSARRWRAICAGAPATRKSSWPSSLRPSAPVPESRPLRVVGQPLPKVDAGPKVIGAAVYADDIALPRMLHCKILRSALPHARILSVDTSAARRMPGVHAVITGHDLPIRFGILPVSQDERALEHEKVRYVGDPMAAVAAVDEETAEAACQAIKVEYEELKSVMSIDEALREPADEP